jgi:RNA polymerase sigma-70 factor, ECF subfamily
LDGIRSLSLREIHFFPGRRRGNLLKQGGAPDVRRLSIFFRRERFFLTFSPSREKGGTAMADLGDWDLSRYRKVLREQAERLRLNPRVQVRVDESDAVQETLKRAVESPHPCRGRSDAERLAWLFEILNNVVCDLYRQHHAGCRDVDREQMKQALDDSTAEYLASLAGKEPSPSEQVQRDEKQERLARAIRQLPDGQREVVALIATEHKTTAEVAALLGKTEGAVAGLYHRGIKRVKELLDDGKES